MESSKDQSQKQQSKDQAFTKCFSPRRIERNCSIVERTGDQVKIHYVGWARKFDEWLPKTSDRLVQAAAEKVAAEKVTVKKSTAEQAAAEESTAESGTVEEATAEKATVESATAAQYAADKAADEKAAAAQAAAKKVVAELATEEIAAAEKSTAEKATVEMAKAANATAKKAAAQSATAEKTTVAQADGENQTKHLGTAQGEGKALHKANAEGQGKSLHVGKATGKAQHKGDTEVAGKRKGKGDSRDKPEGEGEDEEVTPLMFTVAVLISSFLFVNVGLLYLVNYKDENVRSYIFKMISSTMSIFLAVTLNAALFSFLLDQILTSPWPRGLNLKLNLWMEFGVGMFVFMVSFSAVNAVGYYYRHTPDRIYPFRIIGGHITAFAGITTFGALQLKMSHWSLFEHHHYALIPLALFVLILLREASRLVRTHCLAGGNSITIDRGTATLVPTSRTMSRTLAMPPSPSKSGRVCHNDEWRVEVCEAEDDATSLILSFLISQVAIWCVTGNLIPLHGVELEKLHDWKEIGKMFCCFLSAVVAMGLAVLLRRYFPTSYLDPEWRNDPTKGFMRTMNNLQMISAMSMSWFALIAGFWTTQRILNGTLLDNVEMAKVLNAAVLTVVAVLNVIVMDVIADFFREKINIEQMTMSNTETFASVFNDIGVDVGEVADNLERVFRTTIDAYGLLVGLCWEKATDAAVEVLIEGNALLHHHIVISKIGLATVMMVFMFTAWKRYIVPMAQKTYKEHLMDIMLQKEMWEDKQVVQKVLDAILKQRHKRLAETEQDYGRIPPIPVQGIRTRGRLPSSVE